MTIARHWTLDPDVTFLNHGSFGACPRAVLDVQANLRAQMEREPVRFMMSELPALLDAARAALGAFVGAEPDGLAFVPNATSGVNTVVRSLRFEAGDELLATSHGYNACTNALAFVAERAGARVVTAKLPFPLTDPGEVTAAILAAVTPRTKLALVDHVTSPTGLVLPIADVVRELDARGVDTLVDGAHAPGMLPLDVGALGAAYYTGNCHKWLCAPKGAAFLFARADRREAVRPLTISHGANAPPGPRSRYLVEMDWVGTIDPTPYLAVPAAIRFVSELLPGGVTALMDHNRALALDARRILCDALDVPAPAPEAMIGALAAVLLPSEPCETALQAALVARGFEVPLMPWPDPLLRVSAQAYNTREQFVRLSDTLLSLLRC